MIAGEAMLFLLSCLIGVGFGILWDGFRVLRLLGPSGEKIVFIEDGLFFFAVMSVNFLFFLSRTYGQLRVFLLIGEGLGFLIYYLTVGRVVYFVMLRASRLVRTIITGIWQFICRIWRKAIFKTVQKDENPAKNPDSEKLT